MCVCFLRKGGKIWGKIFDLCNREHERNLSQNGIQNGQ